MEHTYFFAVDLGATSGRTILGCLGEGKMELKELTRFPNHIIETGGHCYWDIYALYNEIIRGLKVVAKDNLPIRSIGIDTWGWISYSWAKTESYSAILIATATLTQQVHLKNILPIFPVNEYMTSLESRL